MFDLTRWLPWRFVISRAARAYGIVDPASVLARVRSFAQPSEVKEPIELLRAGVMFQARGLINTRVIQFNLDWVWPYWVERQFNPSDISFVPRGYAATHVNLTQRNWTAVGLPGVSAYPIVDPRGLVTPLYDGWSLDFWITDADFLPVLLPSRQREAEQRLETGDGLRVRTITENQGRRLELLTFMKMEDGQPVLHMDVNATGQTGDRLAAAVRPYNPEGVQFIDAIAWSREKQAVTVAKKEIVAFSRRPEKMVFSNFDRGDVLNRLQEPESADHVECRVELATAAALFAFEENCCSVRLSVPLEREIKRQALSSTVVDQTWEAAMKPAATLHVPDEEICSIYNSAMHTLVLLSAYEPVPGPFTYRRFWIRDAVFMCNALLTAGLADKVIEHIPQFMTKQRRDGYFRSQEGEWDSNGQVLWLLGRLQALTNLEIQPEWLEAVAKGAQWFDAKVLHEHEDSRLRGLLPAGFSAEHLGPNDYYYWDDFWGVAGLRSAAWLTRKAGSVQEALRMEQQADALEKAVFRSLEAIHAPREQDAMPASPLRRMDAGAAGSMIADYPLLLTPPNHPRVNATLEYLYANCFQRGGFFQDMVHSGVNVYISLCLAQTFLRNRDMRYAGVVDSMASLASATGMWPEAVHPFSGGGCMGDGQHGWAASEWVMMLRNMFVREEPDRLVIASGVLPRWLDSGQECRYGPTLTPFGKLSVRVQGQNGTCRVTVEGVWSNGRPAIEAAPPGYESAMLPEGAESIELKAAQ